MKKEDLQENDLLYVWNNNSTSKRMANFAFIDPSGRLYCFPPTSNSRDTAINWQNFEFISRDGKTEKELLSEKNSEFNIYLTDSIEDWKNDTEKSNENSTPTECNNDDMIDNTEYSIRFSKSSEPTQEYADYIKQMDGKIPLQLLRHFPFALSQVVKVREFGNKKYPNILSYKKLDEQTLIGATLRHIMKDYENELDEESGEYHIAHAVVNLLMILEKRKDKL